MRDDWSVHDLHSAIGILDPDPTDPRLETVGTDPVAWVHDGTLTVAVRRSGEPPHLIGTVHERLRATGDSCWALRLRVPGIERACIEYGVFDPATPDDHRIDVWRGPKAGPAAPRSEVPIQGPKVVAESEIAAAHPVRLWSPADPQALLICADGEGLATWASVVAAARAPVALVGIASAGLTHRLGEEYEYDVKADPRARAYLSEVDPPYFAAHMRYVLEDVLPWADQCVGPLPWFAFGVSNGAAFAAAAGALHPDEFAGVLAFSLGAPPKRPARYRGPVHALVAGRLEPGFNQTTTRYAWRLRANGVPVRLRRPMRGHDQTMWADELTPALRWALARSHVGANS